MTERQKEGMRKQLMRQFSRNNRYWSYNGTYFEMSGNFGWRDLDVWVTFRNRESGLEMTMQYRSAMLHAANEPFAVERKFTGEERFSQAIEAIRDYLERLSAVVLPVLAEQHEQMGKYDARLGAAVNAITTDDR